MGVDAEDEWAIPITNSEGVITVRSEVKDALNRVGIGLVAATKAQTAVSEIARNALEHGGGGTATITVDELTGQVRIVITDEGPGIADVEKALADGYTTGSGLGLGLGGAKRLVSSLEIDSVEGRGTQVTITVRQR